MSSVADPIVQGMIVGEHAVVLKVNCPASELRLFGNFPSALTLAMPLPFLTGQEGNELILSVGDLVRAAATQYPRVKLRTVKDLDKRCTEVPVHVYVERLGARRSYEHFIPFYFADETLSASSISTSGIAAPQQLPNEQKLLAVPDAAAQPDNPPAVSWTAFKELESGRFATVMLAKYGDRVAALKMFKTNIRQDVDRELSIWQYLTGVQGVESMKGVLAVDQPGYHKKAGLMDCHELGSLERWLQDRPQATPLPMLLAWARFLAQTLLRVHLKGVRHGDLAPRNILLAGNPEAPTLTIADFGHSLYLPEPRSADDERKFNIDLECFGRLLLQLLAHDLAIKYPMTAQQEEKAARVPQLLELAKELCSGRCTKASQLVSSLQNMAIPTEADAKQEAKQEAQPAVDSSLVTKVWAQLWSDGFVFATTDEFKMKQFIEAALLACAKAGLRASSMDEIKSGTVDLQYLIECMRQSIWSSQLSAEHCKKVFQLLTVNTDANSNAAPTASIPMMDVIHLFVWLGDHNLPTSLAIPATLAIDFVHHCVMANPQIRARFGGFQSRAQLDKQVGDGPKEPVFRFSEGNLLLAAIANGETAGVAGVAGGQTICLHRNLVLTNFADTELPHRLLFNYDQNQRRVVEATHNVRLAYLAVTEKPK